MDVNDRNHSTAKLTALTLAINKAENSPDPDFKDFLRYPLADTPAFKQMDKIVPIIILNTVFKGEMHQLVMANQARLYATYYWDRGFLFT